MRTTNTPKQLGYYFPAEFEPHDSYLAQLAA